MNYLDLIKKEIEKSLESVLGKSSIFDRVSFSVEIPELEHGDVTSNFCLVFSKILKISPKEVFEKISGVWGLSGDGVVLAGREASGLSEIVEKIEFKNPGFVNFYFTEKFVRRNLIFKKSFLERFLSFLNGSGAGMRSAKYLGKKVLVEFCSINLFKPFTIGHLMSNFTGEYIARALENLGAKVIRISYPSDISLGIAKAIYIIKKDGGLGQKVFQQKNSEIVKYLGECYVRGVSEYKNFETEGNLEKIAEIKNIANNLYMNIEGEDLEIFEKTKNLNILYFETMVKTLGTKFDDFIYESEAGVVGKKIVEENTLVFKRSEGAIVYVPDESRKDINTSVFINSEGHPTYLAKDIGLLYLKFKKYSPDYSIYVVDNEQAQHFKSVFDAGGKIQKSWAEKSVHVSHGRMTFKGQKMSSRLGGVPSGEEVINAVYEDVKERSGDRIQNLSLQEKENLQKEIALSALRISILRSRPGVNIDFDPDQASNFEGDSGPYLCYTHARCASLLQKAKNQKFNCRRPDRRHKITKLERQLLQFQIVLKNSAEEIAPQKLVKYLFELAGEFNNFYASTKILDVSNIPNTQFNLYITDLVKQTLSKGLFILGIKAPDKM